MSVTGGIGQTPCSLEHYLVIIIIIITTCKVIISTIYILQLLEQKDCKLGTLQYFPN